MPPSLNTISPPSASSVISPPQSSVIAAAATIFALRVKSPTTLAVPFMVALSAIVISDVVCPIVTAIPDVSVAIFKTPVALVIN